MSKTRTVKDAIEEVGAQLSGFVGSTAQMMKNLVRAFYKIPQSIKDNDRNFIKIVQTDAIAGQVRNENSNRPNNLSQTLGSIQAGMTDLTARNPRNPNAAQMQQYFKQRFAPWHLEAQQRIDQRQD